MGPWPAIGHTRWATHGRVTEANCHPHDDAGGRVQVVMNGILENWVDLKAELVADGAEFTSETDTEVIAHLIAKLYEGDIVEAVRAAYQRLRGPLRFRRAARRRAGGAGGRAPGVPAGRWRGGGRELHRLGHPGVPA